MIKRLSKHVTCLLLVLLCTGCSYFGSSSSDRFGAKQVSFSALDGWLSDNPDESIAAFLSSCDIMARKPKPKTTGSGISIPKDVWVSLCADAKKSAAGGREEARKFFERRFTPFKVNNNGNERGLFTGYYEPLLYGSTVPYKDYKYPLYAAPAGLESKKPHFTHAQINKGALKGKKLELLYVDDPVMIFFLQIQGSGRVMMRDGRVIRVGYAGQNGHEYVSIGKIMGDENVLPKDKINFFTLRQWLYDNPKKAFAMMERNPSFVFFKIMENDTVVGSIGAPLMPWRAMAIDAKYIPYGLPLFLQTELPALPGSSPMAFNRIMIAQDTGGAIRGPVRGDIFFGHGDSAEYMAGYMKGRGVYSLLVPNEVAYQLR